MEVALALEGELGGNGRQIEAGVARVERPRKIKSSAGG